MATKDAANQEAKADVVVDDNVILTSVAATTLIFLEKQLLDVQTFVANLPILAADHTWSYDDGAGIYKAEEQTTHKTKKIQKPIVLYDATQYHPAQTQMVAEDVVVGHWTTVKQSGAIKRKERDEILERVDLR